MKRAERRHLKQNEVANWVTRAVDLFERRRSAVLTAGAIVVAALVVWAGFSAYQARSNAEASAILAEAIGVMNATVIPPPAPLAAAPLDATASSDANATDEADAAPTPATPLPVPPQPPGSFPSDRAKREAALVKFVEAAETQPNGPVGLTARYHAATIFAELGRIDEAVESYQQVRAGSTGGLYSEMAKLGLAELYAIRGEYDLAIATWTELSADLETYVPRDGALMQLGEVYAMAGRETEAIDTFTQIVTEFPFSQYATPAQQEIDRMEGRGTPPLQP